jgi:CBS domain-containing protein
VSAITEKKPIVPLDASLQKAAELLVGADSKLLPVGENGSIIGVVTALDIAKQMKAIPELNSLRAVEIGSLNPIVLQDGSGLGSLVNLMHEKNVSKVPIIGKGGEIKGIVSFSDLVGSLLEIGPQKSGVGLNYKGKIAHDTGKKQGNLSDLPVSNWIVEDVKSVSPDENVSRIIEKMVSGNVSSVVILDHKKLLGIVTLWDLLESFVRLRKERKNIQFVNLPELDEIDLQFLNNSVNECFDKLKHFLGPITYFVVHFKIFEHEGLRKKTLVRLRVSTPGNLFVSSAEGWVLLEAVHEAIDKIQREVFDSKKVKVNAR